MLQGQPFYPSYFMQYQKDFGSKFIKDDIENGVKLTDPKWYKERGEWLLGAYMNDLCYTRFSDIGNYIEARMYGQGKQPNTKYMDILCPVINQGKRRGKRRNWMNISWDIFPVYVRIRNKVLGYMMNFEYYINAHCDDEMSDADRNEIKLKLLLQQQHADFMGWMQEQLGLDDQQLQDLPFQPQSQQEIEMIDQMGGFKLWQELAMEMFCKRSFQMSDWMDISKRLKEDIIDLAVCIIKDYLDPVTMRPKVRYCDPQYTIIRQSINPANTETTEAGEIKFYTAAELLRNYPTITKTDMLKAIAANRNNWGNEGFAYERYNAWHDSMNQAKIAVFEFEFQSINQQKYVMKDKNGMEVPKSKPLSYNEADAKTTFEPTWYECCWIVGTDIVYHYGLRQNAPYTWNSEKCNTSYTAYRSGERSMTNVCIPTIDGLQMTVYKMRNAEIKARPSGYAINWTQLLGMTHNGEELKPFDMLDIAQQTGNVLIKGAVDAKGQPLQGVALPITELEGGVKGIDGFLQLYAKGMNELNDLTGLPPIINAASGDGKMGLGQTQIAESAVADVLRPQLYAYKNVKQRATENICMRWQMLALLQPQVVQSFARETGEVWANLLQMGSEFAFYKYGIDFEAEVNPQIILDVKNAALESMRAGKAGQPGISQADYMFILRQLEHGNLKFIQMYLAWREQVNYKMQQQNAQQNVAANAKSAQDLEQAKSASAAQQAQVELMKESALIDEKVKGDSALSAQGHKQAMELQAQKYDFEMKLQAAAPKPQSSAA